MLTEMEAGIAAMKAAGACNVLEEPVTPVVEHCGTVVTVEDGRMVVSGIPPSMTKNDDRQYFSDSDADAGSSLSSRRRRQNASVSTQTNLTSNDISCVTVERAATPPGEWYSALLTNEPAASALATEQQIVACSLPAAVSSPSMLKNKLPKPLQLRAVQTESADSGKPPQPAEDCQFDMDLSDEEQILSPRLPESTDLSMLGRCISMPSIHQSGKYDDLVDTWAEKQFTTTTMGGHSDSTPTSR
jgi:hypothetical protein